MVADHLMDGLGHLFFFGILAHGHHLELKLVDVAEADSHAGAEGASDCKDYRLYNIKEYWWR